MDKPQTNQSLPVSLKLLQSSTIPAELIQPVSDSSIIIKPSKLQKPKIINNFESFLTKKETETEIFFDMRSIYSKIAISVFQNQINPATAILLGQIAADKATYGVTYPEEIDKVIRYIDEQIKLNY